MTDAARPHRLARLVLSTVLTLWVGTAVAQVCDDFNACTTGDMCSDGECFGTPATGGGCDDFNPCTVNDQCTPFGCMGMPASNGAECAGGCGTCQELAPGAPTFCSPKPDIAGQACEPELGGEVNPCMEGTCFESGLIVSCFPRLRTCIDTDGNECTDRCNPSTGECEQNFSDCVPGCEACNAESGACEPANLGSACDDFDPCTPESRCELVDLPDQPRGFCLAGAPSVPTATPTAPTPTATAPAATPTTTPPATATSVPPTATVPAATATPISPTNTPITASPTPGTPEPTDTPGGPTSTPTDAVSTPTPGSGACAGDCNRDGFVRINELVLQVNIALGNADIAGCLAGDTNGNGTIAINELVGAVNNALGGCPPAAGI